MKYETERIQVNKLLEAAKIERIVTAEKYLEKVKNGNISGTRKMAAELNKVEMLIECLLKIAKASD